MKAPLYRERIDEDGRARDNLGRQQPTRLNYLMLHRAIPGLLEQFKTVVPEKYLTPQSDASFVVACPCGHPPKVLVGRSTECPCGRFYLNMGKQVRVARPEVSVD